MSRRNRLINQEITSKVTALSHEGRGIIHYNNKPIFVAGALIGETIACKVIKASKQYSQGTVVSVSNPHPDRIEPVCDHFNVCGGCSLQHLSTQKQLELKEKNLLNQLENFGGVVPQAVYPAITAKNAHYRRRGRLGVKYVAKKDKVLVGFREQDGRFIADINTCHVLEKSVSTLIKPLQSLIYSLSIRSHIPQIEVAVADNAIVLVFRHLSALSSKDEELCHTFMMQHLKSKVLIYLQPGDESTVEPLCSPTLKAPQKDFLYYSHPELGLKYKFLPTDFIQVNAAMNIKMIDLVIRYLNLSQEDAVLDLFSGIGNLTLAIATQAKSVVGVEGLSTLTVRAKSNALINKLTNVNFFTADLFKDQTETAWWHQQYSHLVLDPARTGAKEIILQLKQRQKRFKRIVYISCNPSTFARDAGLLVNELGYECKHVQVLDMFPHTAHVESLAVFE